MRNGWILAALVALGASLATSPADAAPRRNRRTPVKQAEPAPAPPPEPVAPSEPVEPASDFESTETFQPAPRAQRAERPEPTEAASDEGKSLGLRYRYVVIPKFVLDLFVDNGASIGAHMVGLEYATRKDSFEVVFAATYGAYSLAERPLKSKGEIIEGWEFVEVDLKALYFTSSFLWSTPFSQTDRTFQFLYGGETGLGFIFGNIFHDQAMPVDPKSTKDPTQTPWIHCPREGAHQFCGPENNHYGHYSEPSWFNGGAKPVIFPWISFNTGLLIRPSPKFSARIDLGYNLFNGPFLGAAGNFGL